MTTFSGAQIEHPTMPFIWQRISKTGVICLNGASKAYNFSENLWEPISLAADRTSSSPVPSSKAASNCFCSSKLRDCLYLSCASFHILLGEDIMHRVTPLRLGSCEGRDISQNVNRL